ncbi:MAG: hypothetical protein ABI970_16745 [Chloroflexota bacterium]|nr:hypothetical protein [Anaerolineae bacterium]
MFDYKVEWLVENRVIRIQIFGEYDVEPVQAGIAKTKALVDAGTSPVHVILDSTGVTKMPKSIRELINQMEVLRYHPNGGWIIIVSNNVMLRFAGQIATVFLGANHRSVATYEEAVETICRIDPGIADALRQTLPITSA